MREEAFVFSDGHSSPQEGRIQKLLAFFGIEVESISVEKFPPEPTGPQAEARTRRLFCSSKTLLRLLENSPRLESLHSIFVYSDAASISELLLVLTNGVGIPLQEKPANFSAWEIADSEDAFGGALRGLRITPGENAAGVGLVANLSGAAARPLISLGNTAIFFRLEWEGVPVFISLAEQIIDFDDELTTPNFDLRDHLFSALPIVLYVRWAFPISSWQPAEIGACLVIDDPLLKPRYGFVRFRQLLAFMERHDFSTSIAFIPWNWRRSDPETVRLFQENPDRLSLSIHGCDHTAAEFGTDDSAQLRQIIDLAARRMEDHQARTGLAHDQVMVFPQGVFSAAAMRELKAANFTAAVNTEVVCSGRCDLPLRISDVWDVAVRRYADFPLYTRRYPRQGVENLAFDTLLGKPCLVVIHHDFCRDNCDHLINFIQSLNALKVPLKWRSLQEVLRRSYRRREIDSSVQEIEMYAAEMLIENSSTAAKCFRIRRREAEPEKVSEIRAGSDLLTWHQLDGYLHFEITLPPGESVLICVRWMPLEHVGRNGLSHSGFKTGLRRYLSEFRDNYVVPAKARIAAVSRSS